MIAMARERSAAAAIEKLYRKVRCSLANRHALQAALPLPLIHTTSAAVPHNTVAAAMRSSDATQPMKWARN